VVKLGPFHLVCTQTTTRHEKDETVAIVLVNPSINEWIDETARDGKQMANKKYVTEIFRIGNLFIVKSVHVKELKGRPKDHECEYHHKAHFEHSLFRLAHFGVAFLNRFTWRLITTQY
jgi:hypothetical protein